MLDAAHAHVSHADNSANHPECYGNRAGWIVACTQPQAELWANQNLQRRGYRTYLPLYAARRRDPVLRTLTRIVQRPLFPSYLFCWYDSRDPRRPIRETPGVHDVIRCGSQIQWVRPGAVEAVEASLAEAATKPPGRPDIATGDAVRLVAGPFSGHPAVVTQVGADMATVALLVFGALREVAVQLDALTPRTD